MSGRTKFRSSKFKRCKKSGNRYLLLGVLLFLLLGTVFFLWNNFKTEPAAVSVRDKAVRWEISWRKDLFKNFLNQTIPGLADTTQKLENSQNEKSSSELGVGKNNSRNVINSTLYALTSVDPDDPKTILNAQISTMQNVSFLTENFSPLNFDEEYLKDEIGTDNFNVYSGESLTPSLLSAGLRPLVVIYHSHTTESFVPSSGKEFTEDLSQTVVRAAEELAYLLERDYGVRVIHNKVVHDIPRSRAYEKAADTVKSLVKKYPEAALIIDLHRDGTTREATTAVLNGEEVGRTLLVVGTNHSRWKENFGFALKFNEKSEELFPGLSRGIRERRFTYNQEVHPRAILLEVGGHRNTLEEALRTSRYLAEIIGEILNEI
ncbi:MAG: hypothetical protein CVU88_05350 [Firmicutes bacterium HGW-Firmicutes-13]|nr:MAG: hypothetical protein CVU88_05350 [Firmicutes bacterium HGW-Firmicutes-13]